MQQVPQDPVVRASWLVACRSEDVAEGKLVPVLLAGEDVVLWRSPTALHAWRDLCMHRGVKLSLGTLENCRLRCAYHGWAYDESGQCVHMPAHPSLKPPSKARVGTFHAVEAAGMVWVCQAEEPGELPHLPEFDDASFRCILCGPCPAEAGAPRLIENFLDVAHLPIVHAGTLGVPERAEIGDYRVEEIAGGLLARDIRVFQPDPDGTRRAGGVSYDYGVLAPFTVFLRKRQGGRCLTILFHVTPVTETRSTGHFAMFMNYGDPAEDAAAVDFQRMIFSQDRPVVESQRPERLPLDLAEELHLPSDRLAIAYRKYIRKCGLTFGTA
ncbi:MAG: aromatic ring-hydroxylating dioxygenase subunit alpha [Chthoniobacterales bacterium]|nr:aromatic ring-hydroxylating dioxygenase subunit alpha [Chthoniobacterales bacterium]